MPWGFLCGKRAKLRERLLICYICLCYNLQKLVNSFVILNIRYFISSVSTQTNNKITSKTYINYNFFFAVPFAKSKIPHNPRMFRFTLAIFHFGVRKFYLKFDCYIRTASALLYSPSCSHHVASILTLGSAITQHPGEHSLFQ